MLVKADIQSLRMSLDSIDTYRRHPFARHFPQFYLGMSHHDNQEFGISNPQTRPVSLDEIKHSELEVYTWMMAFKESPC